MERTIQNGRDASPDVSWTVRRSTIILLVLLCTGIWTDRANAQGQQPEDPEDDKKVGLWLDQGVSADFSSNKSLEMEFHERFDEGASNLYEYFVQGGVAFRLRQWLTVLPIYRYQRYPGNPAIPYENRLLFNTTLATSRGNWRPIFRTLVEGRFPANREASARLRLRPGVDYTLPLNLKRRPVLGFTNEFFLVLGSNSFSNNGAFTQDRVQVGVRLPLTDSFSIRPYYLRQFVNLPAGWDSNNIVGISLFFKIPKRGKQSSRAGAGESQPECCSPVDATF